jgi:HD superfamily phosphohydrolase
MVVIFDPLYTRIEINSPVSDLLRTPEVTRIADVKQLGPGYISFPGATHTRKEHCIGVAFLAKTLADELKLEDSEKLELQVAAILHDVAHGPFSHTTEELLEHTLENKHDKRAKDMILGTKYSLQEDNEWIAEKIKTEELCELSDVLDEIGVEKDRIASIIVNKDIKEEYLGQIINSPVDVDRMDFVLRDAHYTGITHGVHEPYMLLKSIKKLDDYLVYDIGGLSWLEQLLIARLHMYGDVYYDKQKRIAEGMIQRALEYLILDKKALSPQQLQAMTDTDVLTLFKLHNEIADVAKRIRYQSLFKIALGIKYNMIDNITFRRLEEINKIEKRREIEREIREEIGMEHPIGVIFDMMDPPEFKELEIDVLSSDRSTQRFSFYSYVTQQLDVDIKKRHWFFRVYALPGFENQVKSATISILKENRIDFTKISGTREG